VLIGELSARTGVSRRALRYYEEQSLLVPERDRMATGSTPSTRR
jgi:DNA-binding transcriptional MerR regulator